jgi:predicted ATPase/class 3 adenylate cyclase
MPDLPSGTVTFLFTDIEGSTERWERDRQAMATTIERHLTLLRAEIEAHGGVLFKTVGDAIQAAFPTAPGAVAAAVAAQRALLAEPWSNPPGFLQVRMALHAGEAVPRDGDYLAAPLNRLARLLAAGHGTQILLTEVVERLGTGALPTGVSLRPLGSHRLRDLFEPEEVFQVVAPGLPDQFPPLRSLPRHATNLAVPPTMLIGREGEIAEVLQLFQTASARLVTLTGAGGVGKTRLAQEIAAEASDRFPNGAFFVDLSPLTDPTLVVPTIAATLGVREVVGQTLFQTLSGFLTDKRLLLLLDNCEQVLESASDIAALLAACPHLAILVTSREPLHIRAEREIAVAPLPLPKPGRLPALAELAGVPAVALFVERAQAAHASFALTEANAAAVAAICRRLDGLPLAIELAAARIKVLPPAALLARLELRLPLLIGGGRDLPARQRTMRDALAWSYDLLPAEEQRVFRCLAVFAGGCTLEAAAAVASQDGTIDVLASIAALVESSLLRQEEDGAGAPRFRMLETVREYGLEQLALAGEADGARQRHAAYFRSLVERQARDNPLLAARESVVPLVADQDNLRLVLIWFDERDDVDALLELSTALYGLWQTRGPYREGLQWIARALERSSQDLPVVRFWALVVATNLAVYAGDYPQAAVFVAEGLAIARRLGDPAQIGDALTNAGYLAYRQGSYGRAEELLREARDLHQGRAVGAWHGIPVLVLGDTALAQEQFDQATAWYAEAIEFFESTDDSWSLSDAQAGLGGVKISTGHLVEAAALYRDSLDRSHDQGFTMLVSTALLGLAAIAATSGQPETGARLLGAAEGLADSLGVPMYPRDGPVRERALAALTATLGEQRLAAAQQAGRALTVEAAIAEAQAVGEAVMSSP